MPLINITINRAGPPRVENEFDAKFIIALILNAGTLVIFLVLMFNPMPAESRDAISGLVTAYLTVGFATMIKFIFDGTKSGDVKNQTIGQLAQLASGAAPRDMRVVNDPTHPIPVTLSPPEWDRFKIYTAGEEATASGVAYVSLQDQNMGQDPATAADWWQKKELTP